MTADARSREIAPRRGWLHALGWLVVAVAATLAMLAVRGRLGSGHVALLYLLVVLGASGRSGRATGLLLAGSCFLAFNFFFVVPYGTLTVRDPLDWVVLLVFLATSAVAAQLLHRARAEAGAANARAKELQRLATLGAEALKAARAEEAAGAVARVVQEELGVTSCELFLRADGSDRLELVARAGAGDATAAIDGGDVALAGLIVQSDARTLVLPLHVHEHPVGFLVLRSDDAIPVHAARHPFAEVLSYYAALGLERIRLSREAEHAAALRETDRMKDALLAAVSHDLRTPLTTIKATAHAIAGQGDERAEEIELEADRLNRYVTNLLDLSRLNADALPVSRELVPMDDLLGATLQQMASVMRGREVQVSLPEDWPTLVGRCDFLLSLRALANLVENAARHGGEGPVEIRAEREDAWIRLDVADRGPGIAPRDRSRLFEPFMRGDAPDRAEGAGLGLAIARRLAEAQGGRLEYAERQGGGSIFSLYLPAAAVAEVAGASL